MLVLGIRPGEGVRIGSTEIVLENEVPERQICIYHPMGERFTVSLGAHRTALRFGDTEVVLWKTRGNSPKVGISSDTRIPVTRIRRDPDGEMRRGPGQIAARAMSESRQD